MTIRKFYMGSVGPLLYDDTKITKDADFGGERFYALLAEDQIKILQTPSVDDEVLRYQDLLLGGIFTVSALDVTDSPYTVGLYDFYLMVDATAGNVVLNFPTATTSQGKNWFVKKVDATNNTVTIEPNAAETVDGVTNYALDIPNQVVRILSDGSELKLTSSSDSSIISYRDFESVKDALDRLSLGDTVTGQTIDGGVGTIGYAYYLSGVDSWDVSSNLTEATLSGQVGICSTDNTIMFSGLLTMIGHGLTIGKDLYVASDGSITVGEGSYSAVTYSKIIGTVEDDDTFRINVSSSYYALDVLDPILFEFQNGDSYTFQDGATYEFN